MARVSASLPGRSNAVAALALGCAALVVVIGYLLASTVDTSPILPGAAPTGAQGQAGSELSTPLDAKPISDFHDTLQRPLFNSNRKPVDRPKSKADTTAQAGSELDMRLVGIVRSDKTPGRALIRVADETMGKWISEGEVINGWKLRTVKDRSVLVEAGGRSHELKMQVVVHKADDQDEGADQGTQPQPIPQPKAR